MVDCAIYSINAVEKRYNYLLKTKQEYGSPSYSGKISEMGLGNGNFKCYYRGLIFTGYTFI